MQRPIWITPNRMRFDSEHRTFNRQVDIITTGNVWGKVQFSNYIRAKGDLECNGRTNPPGHLRAFDLGHFADLPVGVRRGVEHLTETNGGILYQFHYRSRGQRCVLGWVLTTTDHEYLMRWIASGRQYGKAFDVLSEACKYICSAKAEKGV